MFRAGLASLLLFSWSVPVSGQWAIGPNADLALFRGAPRYIAYGLGASATYTTHKRNYWTADAAFHIPHVTRFTYTRGPRDLATGDTTSATWQGTKHESHALITLGFERTFNRRQRSVEWHWKLATGLSIDLNRFKADVTYKYSGEQLHQDYVWHETLFPILIGAGRVWHLQHADLALQLSGMIPCYSITDHEFGLMTRDYSMYLTFHYRWHI